MTNCTHEHDQSFSIMGMKGTNSSVSSNMTQDTANLNGTAATQTDSSTTEDKIDATSKEVPEFEPGMSQELTGGSWSVHDMRLAAKLPTNIPTSR